MHQHDFTFDARDLGALRRLVGRQLVSRQTVHPWFSDVWEGSLRMDLITDDGVVSLEGVFTAESIDELADQLVRLQVRAGDDVRPWTLFGHQGRSRKRDLPPTTAQNFPVVEAVRIVREEVHVEIDGVLVFDLTQDLGIMLTLRREPTASSDTDGPNASGQENNWIVEERDCFVGIDFDQQQPSVKFGSSGGSSFRFGIHTYPGAVNWGLEPGQRLVHSRWLVNL